MSKGIKKTKRSNKTKNTKKTKRSNKTKSTKKTKSNNKSRNAKGGIFSKCIDENKSISSISSISSSSYHPTTHSVSTDTINRGYELALLEELESKLKEKPSTIWIPETSKNYKPPSTSERPPDPDRMEIRENIKQKRKQSSKFAKTF
jgi:hypothetical protein